MPTDIERSCLEQGYRLSDGLTWGQVADRRMRWAIADILASIAVAPGWVGWGVPHIDGVPLKHP